MAKKITITESQFQTLVESSSTFNKCRELISKGYLVHGTTTEWDEFSTEFIKGGSRGKEGYGAYFTDAAYKAEEYGTTIVAVKKDIFNFIELREPIQYGSNLYNQLFGNEENAKKKQELEYQVEFLMNDGRYREALNLYDEIDKLGDDTHGILYGSLRRDSLEAINTYNAQNLGGLQYLIMNPQKNLPQLTNALKLLGYDGGHDGNVYTIWNFDKLNQNLIKIKTEIE